jgi:hypothetical protein
MGARVKCVACGTRARVRQVVGERPAHFNFPRRTSASAMKKAAARAVLARYDLELNDTVDDLWPGAS